MSPFKGRHGPYIIAEVGGNHEGDFDYAVRLARLAADSGADAVKFQVYTGDSLVNPLVDPDRNAHFKRFQLELGQYVELAGLCGELGVDFLASVWDPDALDQLDPYLPFYKIGSGDLTARDMIERTVARGKPVVLSTGLATLEEVMAAVDFITGLAPALVDRGGLALLQCTAMYPIPDSEANLAVMDSLRRATGLPVGYSDHTVGMEALELAAAMGADILETHFTDSRAGKTFRDHQVSATRDELARLVERIGRMRLLKGSPEKRPQPSEIEQGHLRSFRRGVYPARDLGAGETVRAEDLVSLRPLEGIGAEHFHGIVGRRLARGVKRHQPLSWEDFE